MRRSLRGTVLGVAVMCGAVCGVVCAPPAALAQTPAPSAGVARPAPPAAPAQATATARAPRPGEVETDPVRCWWKTDRPAVRIGERFQIALTCGTIEAGPESSRIAAVIQSNQLEGGAVQLTPFEVVSAVRRADVVVPPWRYLQYEYTVRVLNDGFFGQDIAIPALTVTYNLKAPGESSTQGRDETYILPALPMRVLSLVPRSAGDVRDASSVTFADIESRRFLSTAALIAGVAAYAFAALLGILAVARAVRLVRKPQAATAPPLAPSAVLGGVSRALGDLKADVQSGGWTPEAARRGLTALRVASASALGQPVSQRVVARDAIVEDGQLAVRTGWLRRGRAVVSAAVTPAVIAAAPSASPVLEQLGQALRALTVAGYGRGAAVDGTDLDAALASGAEAVRRLRMQSAWPVRAVSAVAKTMGL